jgi:hypothetical protein
MSVTADNQPYPRHAYFPIHAVRPNPTKPPTARTRADTQLTNAVAAAGCTPVIRVPNAEEWLVKRALDAGAHGVMTPMCHTAVSEPNRSC